MYAMESKKTINDLKRLHNPIMEISSSCFILIVTIIDWYSFLFVSKKLILIYCQIMSGFVKIRAKLDPRLLQERPLLLHTDCF